MLVQATLVALGVTLAAAVKPMAFKDDHFVHPDTGNRFQIVGVAYQPGGSAGFKPDEGRDPLSNADVCIRDAALIQALGANAIRVYNLDPNLNHDACASVFNAAGIYMILDVNSPLVGGALQTFNPWESYYAAYLNRTFAVVEAFKGYPNTLAFFSGNEVINDLKSASQVPPYIRAVTRDLKNYIAKHSTRPIPVGYSAADVREVLFDSYNYFQCSIAGEDKDMSRSDIFALNSYSWCGDSSFTTSGYDTLVSGFKGTAVPVFYSEYGCNTPSPRLFTEVGAMYGDQMMGVFSGGVVYEYTQEPNNYGLVEVAKDGSVTLLDDYYTLKAQLAKLDFKKVYGVKAATTPPAPPKCEASLIKEKGFNGNFTLPVLPPGAAEIIAGGVKPTPSGKIIQISNMKVKQQIKAKNGTAVSGLEVKQLASDAINQPGSNAGAGSSPVNTPTTTGSTTSSGSGTAASATTTAPKKDSAAQGQVSKAMLVVAPLSVVMIVAAIF
ncbi:1,3-beta-glucanosyltransferase gel2 [Gaeumannomyces tritici R3-111a-1]|uniref:1,3-beta-glucanosyltransferase n=1 Tax=Gaeumannomyces tritici (strain R3-111a-1) TaxID=644352 RepID=J3PC65_GAET3|nr:1,3-beta-glucanosyltransferase gel2 [Gaeumannomyces tritici R3-111a-1]EJT71835.1 1,3-beta-glucanosyltransferase gel2 [Gaeumannomyces tritici R3-111a-1]